MAIRRVKIGVHDVEYFDAGHDDRYILFLHGGGGSFRVYTRLLEALSKYYHVVSPSMPGAGKSTGLPRGWRFNDYSKFLREFIQKLSIKPYLLGHSFGGAIALNVALKSPDMINSLVLFSPIGIKHYKAAKVAYLFILDNFLNFQKNGLNKDTRMFIKDSILNLFYHPVDFIKMLKILEQVDLKKDLGKINKNVVIFNGRDEKVVPPQYIEKMITYLKRKRLIYIDGNHGFLNHNPTLMARRINREICHEETF